MKNEREKGGSKISAGQIKVGAHQEIPQDGSTCTIVFIKTGSCRVTSDGNEEVTLNAGGILLVGSKCSCTMQAVGHGTSDTVGCSFSQNVLHETCLKGQRDYSYIFAGTEPVALHGNAQMGNRVRTLLEMMRNALQEPDCPDRLYLALVLHYIERGYNAKLHAAARPQNDTVERICAYLAANYTQKLTLSEVAAQFYLSPYYLSRLFRRVTGQSIVDYINNQRIEAAQHLLEETTLSINAVAEQTGFSTAAHFRRVFRELLGVGPQQYRKDHRSHPA